MVGLRCLEAYASSAVSKNGLTQTFPGHMGGLIVLPFPDIGPFCIVGHLLHDVVRSIAEVLHHRQGRKCPFLLEMVGTLVGPGHRLRRELVRPVILVVDQSCMVLVAQSNCQSRTIVFGFR